MSRKRVVKSRAARATSVRCGWCGKSFRPIVKDKKGKRIPKHKADREWQYRNDNLCPGSLVLLKRLHPQAITTHPQALAKKKKVVKRGKATRRKR